ncbi:DNA polymerase III subunit theta [Pantoea sp. 1B4]|uniref:DNA polymerase III subunit theta n=1 Tax=Pantoea sp. 1B4 TaxID=2804760 RepID=UPI001AA45799|nr:DNA polymerase III subunit theta [Pantoea sp. 1B4]MBN1091120.1 DNA polymerase III subunit theta [Pantoea sp. 1B4]
MTECSNHNIAKRSADERERVNIDLAASGVAYKERMNKPVLAAEVELQQPEKWREYFRERLAFYRNSALQFPRGNDPVYVKHEEDK